MAKWDTITDDFPGSALSALWDGNFGGVSVSGNKLLCPSASYSGADSVQHDLSSSSVLIKVEALATGYCGMLLRENGSWLGELNYSGTGSGTLTGRYYGSNFGASDTNNTTNLGAGARTIWFKFRHDGSTLYLEYSSDGVSFTTLHSATVSSSNCDQVEVYLDVGPDPGSSSGNVAWSKLNLATGPALTGSSTGGSATGSAEDKAVALVTSGRVNRQHGAQADYTLCAFCKPNASGATQGFMCTNPNTSGGSRSGVFYGGSGARFRLEVNGSFTNATNTSPTGSWYHVAFTVTGTTATLYVNGAQEATATVSSSTKLSANDWITLGAWRFTSGGVDTNFLNATVDEFMFFTRVLSIEEIKKLADRTRHEPHYQPMALAMAPYFWWRLSDTSGTTAADASGNGRTGTYTGTGVTYSQSGAIPFTSPPELAVTRGLDGSANGSTSTSSPQLAVALALTGTADGATSTSAQLGFEVPLDGSASGATGTSAELEVAIGLTGSAAGALATEAPVLTAALALVGTADGVTGTSAELAMARALAGTAAGATGTTAALTVVKSQMELVNGGSRRSWEAGTAPPRWDVHKNGRRSWEVAL